MKRTFTFPVAATVVMLALGLTNCKKESTPGNYHDSNTSVNGIKSLSEFTIAKEDRIDEIVRDLAEGSYSLSFDKATPSIGISRTAYGADNYLVYADPQDVICPDPIRKIQRYVPIWKIPTFVPPTCEDMIYDPLVFEQIQKYLLHAAPEQFRGLEGIKLANGGVLLANKSFNAKYANLQVDKMDEVIKGLNAEKFILLNDTRNRNSFGTRDAYGYANLDEYVFKPYKKSLKDLFRPILIGCFDPEILAIIKERFQEIDPATYKGLGVNPIEEAGNIATLGMGQ